MPDEKRYEPRQRTYLGGRIVQDDGLSIACVIRNLSATGAMVEVPPLTNVPDAWVLLDVKNGLAHRVSVTWRKDTRLGVRFEHSYDLNDTVPDHLRHVQHLWQVRGDSNL